MGQERFHHVTRVIWHFILHSEHFNIPHMSKVFIYVEMIKLNEVKNWSKPNVPLVATLLRYYAQTQMNKLGKYLH